ncbi:MAG: NAD(P)/FAD-dependent oxidoreductase [Pseudomonadales bacterium]
MTRVCVLGGGLGGVSMAYDLRKNLPKGTEITVVSERDHFEFTPSNPWVAVGWRTGPQIKVDLVKPFKKKKIELVATAAKRIDAAGKRLELVDGNFVDYDYLVIATGPALAFDEIEGLGPNGFTTSVCTTTHAEHAFADFEKLVSDPGPVIVGAAQGASCFGPAYEYLFILETELRKRKIRDRVPMWYVTSEPYIGHLGLDGVGDTKSMLESELRERHVRWLTNAKIDKVEAGKMHVSTVDDKGNPDATQTLEFKHSMILPAFRGVPAVMGVEGLTNPRGFIVVDEHQRNPAHPEIYGIGVAVAIPPVRPTPVPTGTPKTGYMIESMVTATAHNIAAAIAGKAPADKATWNAVCLADFGDRGVAFAALPQIPPRNVNWSSEGKWVHLAKIGFEKYFMRKVKQGDIEPYYEKAVMNMLGVTKLKGA